MIVVVAVTVAATMDWVMGTTMVVVATVAEVLLTKKTVTVETVDVCVEVYQPGVVHVVKWVENCPIVEVEGLRAGQPVDLKLHQELIFQLHSCIRRCHITNI